MQLYKWIVTIVHNSGTGDKIEENLSATDAGDALNRTSRLYSSWLDNDWHVQSVVSTERVAHLFMFEMKTRFGYTNMFPVRIMAMTLEEAERDLWGYFNKGGFEIVNKYEQIV